MCCDGEKDGNDDFAGDGENDDDDDAGDGEDPEGGGAGGQRAGLLHIPQVMMILMIRIIKIKMDMVMIATIASTSALTFSP